MKEAQIKIEALVTDYQNIFPDEFSEFRKAIKTKQDMASDKFAAVQNTNNQIIERVLFEIPETLYGIFLVRLEEQEMKYLDSKEGSRWFAKKFPQYRVAQKF